MIPSRRALSSIEEAILGVRRDEDRLTAMLRSATEETARLRARQAEAYKALARLRLDEIAGGKVARALDTAEREALAALNKRTARLAEITSKRASLIEAVAAGEKRLDECTDRLAKAIDAVEELAEKTRARLAGDQGWRAAQAKVAEAEATAAAAAEKAAQAEADLAEKRKPYDADPVFVYLWKRGFGTAAYRAGLIARLFDRLAAKRIGYEAARRNYYMLTEIPVRLREHAERQKAAVEAAKAAQVAFERQALEADGVEPLEAAAAEAEESRTALSAELDAMKAGLAALDKEQAALVDPASDNSLARAIEGLAAAIAREDLAALHRAALATPTPEDERIIATLREIEPALKRREAEAEEVRKAAVALARKRAELEESRASYYRAGYDDPRGRFDNEDLLGDIIGGVLGGILSSRNLNDAMNRGYSSRGRGSSFGGGLRLPSRPSAPSRPRGGFRTGGRF
jgi:hypothetical protein